MSEYKHKAHNVSVLLYHFVCPTKYRRLVISEDVDNTLKKVCQEISMRYEIEFIEIGTDKDHVHFLIQAVPTMSPAEIINKVKSIKAREIFKRNPEVKKQLWGGNFWTSGYFVNTAGASGSEAVIREYVKNQGIEKEYKQLLQQEQLNLNIFL